MTIAKEIDTTLDILQLPATGRAPEPVHTAQLVPTSSRKRMSPKELIVLKEGLKLTKVHREVLVGLLLGDGSLQTRDQGRTYRLVYSQGGERHMAYVDHVHSIFGDWVVASPRSTNRVDRGRSGGESLVRRRQVQRTFATVSHGRLRFYGRAFYRNGKKVVPAKIGSLLTERGLAFWYMDNGSMKSMQSKGVMLNTHSFDLPEVRLLCWELGSRFGLRAIPRLQRNKAGIVSHQIYISGHSYERLGEIILPHLLPEMAYKFPPPRVPRPLHYKMKTEPRGEAPLEGP